LPNVYLNKVVKLLLVLNFETLNDTYVSKLSQRSLISLHVLEDVFVVEDWNI